MPKKTYKGSCQCGRVTFEADIDLPETGTGKCNCTSCWKRRWWSVRTAADSFRALTGESELSEYKPGQARGHRGFCKHCGVRPYGWVDKAEWNDTEYVSVNVACLDDLEPAELMAAPIQYMDGRANNWWHPPAETRHL
ncbi:MAG TPA: GFA family protein [Polyangia bacterium]